MKHLLLLGGGLLLAATAQAQATFSVGPRVGLNVSTVHLPVPYADSYSSRAGFEAGLTGTAQFGHFALQPSVLFSQKGYDKVGALVGYGPSSLTYAEQLRLNYLTVPLNLAFTLGEAVQGLQVFAGPYVSLLVGGHYTRQVPRGGYSGIPAYTAEVSGKVKPADVVSDSDNEYSKRVDTGLQAGVGYRLGGFLLQANYSLGLRNLATQYRGYDGRLYDDPGYYNRLWQVSLSYFINKS